LGVFGRKLKEKNWKEGGVEVGQALEVKRVTLKKGVEVKKEKGGEERQRRGEELKVVV
jgi:hypothetical protein